MQYFILIYFLLAYAISHQTSYFIRLPIQIILVQAEQKHQVVQQLTYR